MSACSMTRASANKRKRWSLVAICTLALLLVVLFLWMPTSTRNDPIYDGRRLSSWLQKYPHTGPQPIAPLPEGPLPEGTPPVSLQETERFYRKIFGNEVAEAHRVLLRAGRDAFPTERIPCST